MSTDYELRELRETKFYERYIDDPPWEHPEFPGKPSNEWILWNCRWGERPIMLVPDAPSWDDWFGQMFRNGYKVERVAFTDCVRFAFSENHQSRIRSARRADPGEGVR